MTTNTIDGKQVISYLGIVSAEVIFGASILKELVGAYTDFSGGRSGTYEREFAGARQTALKSIEAKALELKADAVVGLRCEYLVLGEKNGMMMVAAYGTAVNLMKSDEERRKDRERAQAERANYFVALGDQEKGPFSLDQLRELHAKSRLDEDVLVRLDGSSNSVRLADLIHGSPSTG